MRERHGTSARAKSPFPAPGLVLLVLAPLVFAAGCADWIGGLPPTVVYATPADGSGNVPVKSAISALFSTTMDPATIDVDSFTLRQAGIPVAGSVGYSDKTATFTPTATLPGNAVFTATITTAAKDVNGVAVESNQTWTFMTVSGPAGSMTLYYAYNFNGNPWTRSLIPVTLTNAPNVVSQTASQDGSVTITITNAPAVYEDNGIYFAVGTLGNFNSLLVVAASGSPPFSANLFLDVDKDGEFFAWTANVFQLGVGSDVAFAASSVPANDVLAIDSKTTFGGHTLAQLNAGVVPGVGPGTPVAIWLGIAPAVGLSQTLTIQSIKVN
jgi:hypothetical protein